METIAASESAGSIILYAAPEKPSRASDDSMARAEATSSMAGAQAATYKRALVASQERANLNRTPDFPIEMRATKKPAAKASAKRAIATIMNPGFLSGIAPASGWFSRNEYIEEEECQGTRTREDGGIHEAWRAETDECE